MKKYFMMVALAFMTSACASSGGALLLDTTNGEHYAVNGVHVVVIDEQKAFQAGAITPEQHQKNVATLTTVVKGEKTLNDALQVWQLAGATGPLPAEVSAAIQGLVTVLNDVKGLIPLDQTGTVGILVDDITNTLGLLTGSKQ